MIENHVVEQFDVEIIGRTNDIIEHYYLISPEWKVIHPGVQHLLPEGKKSFKKPML
jgi:LysR family transcriptional activator of nhaA